MTRRALLGLRFFALLFVMFVLCSCAGSEYFQMDGKPILADPEYVRQPPEVRMPQPSWQNAVSRDHPLANCNIDLTNQNQGYVVANCTSGTGAYFKITKDAQTENEQSYSYVLANDGTNNVFPLSMGNGSYRLAILVQAPEAEGANKYYSMLDATVDVKLESGLSPYLIPNQIVNYTPDSEAVKYSFELAKNCSTDLEVVRELYYWIANNITYDTEKAESILSKDVKNYVPKVDETLASKKGICYDYAVLAATMLRANGIPCQLAMGYVTQNGQNVYHAWNYIWLKEGGEIAVKLSIDPEDWGRIDLTFAASGDPSISKFIGDGSNYSTHSLH